MTPEPPTRTEAGPDEAERRLRAALAEAAHEVAPAPVPLAAIAREGRTRRRRRATALASGCALAVAAVTLTLVQGLSPAGQSVPARPPVPVQQPPAPSPPSPPAPPRPPRTVAPGERVAAGGGWTVWLTDDGKHWSGPDGYENSRSVTDGNVDADRPGITHQAQGDARGTFHSGLYYGTTDAARMEITGANGRKTTATLLRLPGEPAWGVWYASTPPTPTTSPGTTTGTTDSGTGAGTTTSSSDNTDTTGTWPEDRVTLYDTTGRIIATLP
ncbi:hypothetical protein J5J01_06425 [Streptomyces fradiae]|uniref:hypothetical protein n=1 Tax=Streptomyces fradiae TaxID=1906 RepID=UPI002018CAEA|nr:hypothetical protein [Streptomyces fradiae]UQS31302.1 hypothetical protein J5J01_06425 [Streptomyces fradiae]